MEHKLFQNEIWICKATFPWNCWATHATNTNTGNKPKRRSATMLGADRRSQGEDQGEGESGAAGLDAMLDKEAPIEPAYRPISSPPAQIIAFGKSE